MNREDEDAQTLTKLGLTTTEARVYLALVKTGTAKAPEIAKASDVARPDIYRTITQLQELGLVEKIVSSPNEFRAIPIFDALSLLFQRRENENAQLTQKADILLEKYNALQKNQPKESANQFIMIPEKETLIRERIKAIENSKQQILIIIPFRKLGPVITTSFEKFSNALKRKVNIQIITEKTEDENTLQKIVEALLRNPKFEVRTIPPPVSANFGIYDGKEIMLSTSAKSGMAEAPDIWSNNPDIVELAMDYFNMKWTTAEPQQTPKQTSSQEKKKIRK